MKLWAKNSRLLPEIERFTAGEDVHLDQVLVPYDCRASAVHARMLQKIGVLTPFESEALQAALEEIIRLHAEGKFQIRPEQEDCHTAIEEYLTQKLGEIGKKIHTGRSRNDQVLTALRLYYKDELQKLRNEAGELIGAFEAFSERFGDVPLPGYTHTRKAMPSSVGLWVGAFVEAMQDNLRALDWVTGLVDQCPLGAGAGYGVPLPLDREFTAGELGFGRVQQNPLYTQNSRGKLEASLLHGMGLFLLDLNKFASDVIFFSQPELGFLELSEAVTTGSSIMPHKKNPDPFEILRAHYHRVLGNEMSVRSLAANLISGYHRDFQLLKRPVMDSFQMTHESLAATRLLVREITVNERRCREAMTEELYSVERAMQRVQQGKSFRDAYFEEAEKWRKKGHKKSR